MKKLVVCITLFCTAAAAPTLLAQGAPQQPQKPPTFASVLNGHYGIIEQEVVSAAEAMPEDKTGSHPPTASSKAYAHSRKR